MIAERKEYSSGISGNPVFSSVADLKYDSAIRPVWKLNLIIDPPSVTLYSSLDVSS